MAQWATTIVFVWNLQFLCVFAESAWVALSFHDLFDFGDRVVNGYVSLREFMPRGFGQLGCSGFVISNADGNFVSRKTSAYLQVSEGAFQQVESILSELVPSAVKKLPASPISTTIHQPKQKRQKYDQLIIKPPALVGVDSMDNQHKECTDSFNRAVKDQTNETLRHLHAILKEHFKHEDEQYSPQHGSFSKLTSHTMDHAGILNIATTKLDHSFRNSGGGDACSIQQGGRE